MLVGAIAVALAGPAGGAAAATGTRTQITIGFDGSTLAGKVRSHKLACRAHRKLVIRRGKRKLGQTTSTKKGKWRFRLGPSPAAGRYRAVAPPRRKGSVLCEGARSARVKVKPAECPASLPAVGPYMKVACDESTGNRVRFSCSPDWLDSNQDPADGCEAEKDGLQTMWFQPYSALALEDHIRGSFSMNGYLAPEEPPPSTDWCFSMATPCWFEGPSPISVEVSPDCASNPSVACPDGQPEDPPPTLELDLSMDLGDSPRVVVSPTGTRYATGLQWPGTSLGYDEATTTTRFRLSTEAPIPFTLSNGTGCDVAIQTTAGSHPDIQLDGTLDKRIDPDTNQGEDGPPQLSNVTLSNLEGADYSVEGGLLCEMPVQPDTIAAVIKPALESWLASATRLCGAPGPYWWQPCPPSTGAPAGTHVPESRRRG